MSKKLILIIVLTIGCNLFTEAQTFEWAKGIGSTSQDEGNSITVDASGNVYTTGFFSGTVDFDPAVGVFNLTSAGAYADIFISKLDASGNFVWAKSFGGTNFDEGNSIDIDAYGNVYTSGSFIGTVDFDPGVGIYNLTASGSGGTFISKLDAAGNFIWAKVIDSGAGNSIAIDNDGNVYTTSHFKGTVDFDPGVGTYNLISTSMFGDEDVYISKLDSGGNFIWAKNMGGTSDDRGVFIDVDTLGNIYTTGYFNGTADFDPGIDTFNLVSTGARDIFISKLDSTGKFIWAKSIGGTAHDQGFSLVADNMGNVYTTGLFQSVADFDPGVGVFNLTSSGVREIFISKLDTAGNFIWAKKIGGSGFDDAKDIAVDAVGNVYSTGAFEGTVDFDPGINTFNLTAGGADIYISKLDAGGNFVWAKNMGGAVNDVGNSIFINATDNLYLCGFFNGTTDFDPGVNTYNITSAGVEEIFIQKLSPCNSSANYSYVDNGNGNYTFTNTSSGDFNKSHWAFGDGNTSITTNINHTFTANGTFVVVLTVADTIYSSSCFDYRLDTITVTGVVSSSQCNAGFVIYPDTLIGNVSIVNSSTGSNLTYLWDFGDGDTSTLQNPTHVYATAGPYYLCLTVDDGASCMDVYCDSIGENGVVFKQAGFTINVISPPIITEINNVKISNSVLEIYPNPANADLTFVTDLIIKSIIILDVSGKEIKSIIPQTNKIEINDLTNGIYFLKIVGKEQTVIRKFVKQ